MHDHRHHHRRSGRGEGHCHPEGYEYCGPHGGSRGDCCDERHEYRQGRCDGGEHHHHREHREGGPDTRFLQLEMSQVLYGEAESLTKRAFRELLLESAKARFRERFGDKITGLAQLAVDELMADMLANLEIEARIQGRNRERGRIKDRLRDIFAAGGPAGECGHTHEEGGGCESRPPCPEDEGDEGGGGTGHHEDQ
jgi:hypothetical protein